ncbi:MAG: PilZ domain-containing protein [Pyrinomonadaceae bacterium]
MDRRSGLERRATVRKKVSQNIEWENAAGRYWGTLSDVSEQGCFVLSSGEISEGETLKLFLPVGGGMKMQVLGEVKNHVFEIGFALRFVELSEAQRSVLREFIAKNRDGG